jgi:hypothetical protein
MTMKPGTVTPAQAFDSSLAEQIEHAFMAELLAVKGEPAPKIGVDERRMLFAAIAQGVVAFLRNQESAFEVAVQGASGVTASVSIQAPQLTLALDYPGGSRRIQGTGSRFPSGSPVTLSWLPSGQAAGTATPSSGGGFTVTLAAPPADATSGRQVVAARNTEGHAAVGVVTL